jgi:hypothetical protein
VCEPFRRGNTGLRPVRQADILSPFRLNGSGVQLRWAHRPGGLCSTSYLADNLNLSASFRRRRPESERHRSYRPLACVPEINAAMRTPQKPGGPVLKRVNRACKSPKALALGASASIGTPLAPAVFKARICQLLQSRHTNKAGL